MLVHLLQLQGRQGYRQGQAMCRQLRLLVEFCRAVLLPLL